MATFEVTVYLDTVCPWCYIGHRALDRAIELYQRTYPGAAQAQFRFTWRPYYLNAHAPLEGVPMLERMAEKNGADRVQAICTRLERVGRAYGIAFSFDGRTGNTRDSHRLIYCARSEQQKVLVETLFAYHFEHGGDITSHDLLMKAALAAGLSESEARDCLESDNGSEVDQLALQARQTGISSVPTVDINGLRIEGAEDVSVFYEAFITAAEASRV